MSGMKGAQRAPPFGRSGDGRFVRVLNDAVLIRQRGRAVRSCNPARQSVAQSGAVRYARKQDPWDGRIICWNARRDKGVFWRLGGSRGRRKSGSVLCCSQSSFVSCPAQPPIQPPPWPICAPQCFDKPSFGVRILCFAATDFLRKKRRECGPFTDTLTTLEHRDYCPI